eukprot:Pgem_evm1s16595
MSVASQKDCIGIECGKPATMQCPTCIKYKMEPSFFCAQDCFKKNWVTHKKIHVKPIEKYDPWGHVYNYTGDLRA